MVSAGDDDRLVHIWRMDQVLDWSRQPVPSVLKVKPKDFKLFSVAISPDNRRIFVEGRDKEVFIRDTQTLLYFPYRFKCRCCHIQLISIFFPVFLSILELLY